MHELALAASLIELVEEQARAHGLSRVVRVSMAIGDLAVVERDALRIGFELAAKETVAEGAELVVQAVAGRGRCIACSATVDVAARGVPCSACGSYDWVLVSGDELRLTSLEGS